LDCILEHITSTDERIMHSVLAIVLNGAEESVAGSSLHRKEFLFQLCDILMASENRLIRGKITRIMAAFAQKDSVRQAIRLKPIAMPLIQLLKTIEHNDNIHSGGEELNYLVLTFHHTAFEDDPPHVQPLLNEAWAGIVEPGVTRRDDQKETKAEKFARLLLKHRVPQSMVNLLVCCRHSKQEQLTLGLQANKAKDDVLRYNIVQFLHRLVLLKYVFRMFGIPTK
jgi:hypothetical protein